ncbi:MAG: hypothetical protein ACLRMZ_27565 [Blautia marasmi]
MRVLKMTKDVLITVKGMQAIDANDEPEAVEVWQREIIISGTAIILSAMRKFRGI